MIFVADNASTVRVFDNDGQSQTSLSHPVFSPTTGGMCFETDLFLALPDAEEGSDVGSVGRFGDTPGAFGSGYLGKPCSLAVNGTTNIFVGQKDNGTLLKFSSSGDQLAAYELETEVGGVDWMAFDPRDQTTLLYTSGGSAIKRFSVASDTQLPDFASLTSPTALVVLTTGQVLVVDGDRIVRLSPDGTIEEQIYTVVPSVPFTSLVRDADGLSIWALNSLGGVVRFSIEEGEETFSFPSGGVDATAIMTDAGWFGLPVIPVIPLRPAAAVYHLGSSWPTLIEEQTDPTEGIITEITKKIVPVRTPLPEGFAESFPLDIYRSIQIVSKVDLHSLPEPEIYDTTQHVSFPQQLIACYPIWDVARQQSTAGGAATGTQRGSVSASVSVHGAIVLTTVSGFRGAAMGRIEREFFSTLDAAKAATEGIIPTIIRPSSGTAVLRTSSNSSSKEGLTYNDGPPLNTSGQPAQSGDPMPGGGTYGGGMGAGFASKATSSGSSSANTQVKDINDVLTAGFDSSSVFSATNSSNADVLAVSAIANGSFTLVIPASVPTIILPGQAVLAQVVLEKWRFGLYVRSLIYLQAPVTE